MVSIVAKRKGLDTVSVGASVGYQQPAPSHISGNACVLLRAESPNTGPNAALWMTARGIGLGIGRQHSKSRTFGKSGFQVQPSASCDEVTRRRRDVRSIQTQAPSQAAAWPPGHLTFRLRPSRQMCALCLLPVRVARALGDGTSCASHDCRHCRPGPNRLAPPPCPVNMPAPI